MLIIGFKAAFLRQLKKLPLALQQETKEKLSLFKNDPAEPSLRVHKLKGKLKGRLSFSVNYQYRIIFVYEKPNAVVLLAIGDHSIYE